MKNYILFLAGILAIGLFTAGFANNFGIRAGNANEATDTRVEVINADNKPVPVKGMVGVESDDPFEVGKCYTMTGPANVSLGRNKILAKKGFWVQVKTAHPQQACSALNEDPKWINTGLISLAQ